MEISKNINYLAINILPDLFAFPIGLFCDSLTNSRKKGDISPVDIAAKMIAPRSCSIVPPHTV